MGVSLIIIKTWVFLLEFCDFFQVLFQNRFEWLLLKRFLVKHFFFNFQNRIKTNAPVFPFEETPVPILQQKAIHNLLDVGLMFFFPNVKMISQTTKAAQRLMANPRLPLTSKMERFATIVNCFQTLTFVERIFILHVGKSSGSSCIHTYSSFIKSSTTQKFCHICLTLS